MTDYLKSLFEYNHWANEEVHRHLRSLQRPPERATAFMNHMIAAELLWLARLKGEEPTMAVWPDLNRNQQHQFVADLRDIWTVYLGALKEESLSEEIAYVNSKGEPFTSRVQDVLMHVLLHASYHRGQIASTLRDAGREPVYTDFIHAVRTNAFDHM